MTAPTTRQLAAGQVRSLRAVREKLLKMAAQWDELDQFNMGELQDLADRCETVAVGFIDADAPAGGLDGGK